SQNLLMPSAQTKTRARHLPSARRAGSWLPASERQHGCRDLLPPAACEASQLARAPSSTACPLYPLTPQVTSGRLCSASGDHTRPNNTRASTPASAREPVRGCPLGNACIWCGTRMQKVAHAHVGHLRVISFPRPVPSLTARRAVCQRGCPVVPANP